MVTMVLPPLLWDMLRDLGMQMIGWVVKRRSMGDCQSFEGSGAGSLLVLGQGAALVLPKHGGKERRNQVCVLNHLV